MKARPPPTPIKFTVPEVWRSIVKKNERQGSKRYDVLVCQFAVPANDDRPPVFGVEGPPEAMRGSFENREGEQRVVMSNAQVLQLFGGDVGGGVDSGTVQRPDPGHAAGRPCSVEYITQRKRPDHWPNLSVLDRAERIWRLVRCRCARCRRRAELEPLST